MKKDSLYWIDKWKKSKNFRVENDRIKPKSYLFSSFPKTNLYGFQDGNIRPLLIGDFFSRYQRMAGFNVLYPIGFDSLGLSAFLENKRHSNIINDDISLLFEEQMLKLGVGIDNQKKIDLKHNEYVSSLQLSFIQLYEKKYIKYDYIDVVQDKTGKKIMDTYFETSKTYPNKVKAFYLDISSIKDDIALKIKELNVSPEIRTKLFNMLDIKTSAKIDFSLSNGSSFSVDIKEPEYLGGVSFIAIHPDYLELDSYILYEELEAIENYLSDVDSTEFGVFSGCFAVNPLTGKNIPIFVSVNYKCPIYLGNPYLNSDDRQVALEEGLPIIDIVQNGVYIESDFLNGIPEAAGHELIINNFLEAEMCTVNEYYSKDKILVSSLDNFGALIPFLRDGEDKLYSLKKHLPFTFSPKFRPILAEDIDVPGSIINGSINHVFSQGMLLILAMLYDDIGASISIFSKDAINIYNMWNGIDLLAIKENELFENVFIPTCIYTIIEKEKEVCLPPLFKDLIICNNTYDENYLLLTRANNNLFNISKYLDEFKGDSIRLYFLSKLPAQDFVFDEAELASIANLVSAIEDYFYRPFAKESCMVEEFKELVNSINECLFNKDVYTYTTLILNYYKINLWNNQITYKEALLYLKLIYPICPFIADDIYQAIFKGKYLISDDGWLN